MGRCSRALMPTLLLASSVVILEIVQSVAFQCGGLSVPVGILPPGDKFVKYGNPIRLYCTMDESHPDAIGRSSRDLSFFTFHENRRIPIESTIVNRTTIETVLEDLPTKTHLFYCSLKLHKGTSGEKTCFTSVEVGFEPQQVKNFSCVSLNWEKLICKWYPPETYINSTRYTLMYFPSNVNRSDPGWGTSAGRERGRRFYRCPGNVDRMENMCILSGDTEPLYRQGHEYYKFRLVGTNALGNSTTIIDFHHYAHVIPNKPENIEVVNKTLGSVVVNWTIPYPMNNFPKGLRSKIEYKSKWDPPDKWNVILIDKTTENRSKFRLYNITGLQYAHTLYDLRIYLKSRYAAVGDSFWSEPGTLTFTTPSTEPGRAPNTTHGSFHVTMRGNDSELFVYWSRIPEYLENGEDFGYNVSCTMNNKYNCDPPIEKTLSYAKYTVSNNNEYLFRIYSVNRVGRSLDTSYVFVPKPGSVPRPESFTNVPYANGVHELSWKPVLHKNLSNYTIFWCEDDQSLPLPCRGLINWIEVDKTVTEKNITMKSMKKFYKFAIAANFNDGSSSGMVWFSCVLLHDKVDRPVNIYIEKVVSREADIVWQIECAQSSSFGGYYLYYCPVSSQNNTCQENHPEKRILIADTRRRNVTLKNLTPYTSYQVQISVMVNNGTQEKIGPRSPPKRFTTLEDAPSEPLNLRHELVTNSSILLAWDLPLETNGVLQIYQLDIESKFPREERTVPFEAKDSNDALVTRFEIGQLSSYTSYNLTLRACTSHSKCSRPSSPIVVRTGAGVPGRMAWPRITCYDNATADIAWERPNLAAGDLNYYELSVSINGSYTNVTNVTGTRINVPWPDWNTTFMVRAINVDGNAVYRGPWSRPASSHCTSVWMRYAALLFWIFGICTFSVTSAALYYFVKRGWLHCRKMKDVEVKLPPGLQSQDLEKDNQDYMHLDPWPPRPSDAITGSLGPGIAPDEESLLGKKSDEDHVTQLNVSGKNGGDSSGCSVGRESMSSSVTSDNHASSDSGAEADQCVNTQGIPFSEWESLKERVNCINDSSKNRGHSRKVTQAEEPPTFLNMDDWTTPVAQATAPAAAAAAPPAGTMPTTPGYTRVGFTDGPAAEKSLPEKGYVTIASIAPLSPPQKAAPETNYSALPLDNLPLLLLEEEPRSPEPEEKPPRVPLPSALPCYVTLACLQERRQDGRPPPPAAVNGPRAIEAEKSQDLNELLEEAVEASSDSLGSSPSSTETEREVSLQKSAGPMPPYVSMSETPARAAQNGQGEEDYEDEEEDEEEREKEEELRLSPDVDLTGKKNINGIDAGLVERAGKDPGGSYSNYLPHRIFGKESLHTQ